MRCGAASSRTRCCRSPIAKARSRCGASRSARPRRSPQAGRATCSCAAARSAIRSSCAPRRPATAPPSRRATARRCSCFWSSGDAVDVNVHPSKLEVRFRDKFFVEKVVEQAVRAALAPLAAAAPLGAGSQEAGVGAGWLGVGAGVPLDLFARESLTPGSRLLTPPLLQVFDTYILFQTDSSVAIVDQHSAHERVLYEDVMRQLTGDGASAQRLLLPLTLEFSPPELEAIDAHRELLQRVGFELEPFSGRSVVVHTVPNPHPRSRRRAASKSSSPIWPGGVSAAGRTGSNDSPRRSPAEPP